MIFLNNIRGVVISYSLVIAVMLLQTPVRNIGTICAVGTMAFTLVCLFLNKNNTKGGFSKEFLFLFLFTLYMLLQASLSSFSHMTDSVKFIVQSIFICFLFRVGLNKNEYRFLMYAYEIFISIWAILIIKSCIDAGPFRYIHSPIDLFGSKIDPNYIGIPLVSASIFLLNDILNVTKKKLLILFIFCFLLNVIAIVQTSSRGNLLSFVLGNGLLFYNYL